MTTGCQMRVDGSEQPLAQIMLLQQVPEVQDRRLIPAAHPSVAIPPTDATDSAS